MGNSCTVIGPAKFYKGTSQGPVVDYQLKWPASGYWIGLYESKKDEGFNIKDYIDRQEIPMDSRRGSLQFREGSVVTGREYLFVLGAGVLWKLEKARSSIFQVKDIEEIATKAKVELHSHPQRRGRKRHRSPSQSSGRSSSSSSSSRNSSSSSEPDPESPPARRPATSGSDSGEDGESPPSSPRRREHRHKKNRKHRRHKIRHRHHRRSPDPTESEGSEGGRKRERGREGEPPRKRRRG